MPQKANETQDTSLLLFGDLKKHAPGLIVQGAEQNEAEVALVSRLIFVQFLQENGYLGTKRENYLQNAAQMVLAKGQSLYEDFVKILFDQILSVPLDCRTPTLSEHPLFQGLPYLDKAVFALPFAATTTVDSERLHQLIYSVFPKYNWHLFTADKTPDGNHLPNIEPWVLGYLYERGINRKDTGTYFTPDDLCYNIARHAIENWLLNKYTREFKTTDLLLQAFSYTDKATRRSYANRHPDVLVWIEHSLKTVRIIDPAVGAGAFLVAAANVLMDFFQFTSLLHTNGSSKASIIRRIFERNIYGIDVASQALDLAKLRLWLLEQSLLSTSTLNHVLAPMNNLTVGDALVPLSTSSSSCQLSIFDDSSADLKQADVRSFLSRFDGFDISLGNPPFVPLSQQNNIRGKREFIEHWNAANPTYPLKPTSDLSTFFILRGIEILNPEGTLSYITSRNFFDTKYGKSIRRHLTNEVDLRHVFTLHTHPFTQSGMKAKANTVILTLNRGKPAGDSLLFNHLADWQQPLSTTEGRPVKRRELALSDNWTETLFFQTQIRKELISLCTTTLSQYTRAKMGVKTGWNAFFLLREDREPFLNFFANVSPKHLVPAVKNSRGLRGFIIPRRTPFRLLNLYSRVNESEPIFKYIQEYGNRAELLANRISIKGHYPEWYTLSLPNPPAIAVQCIVDTTIGVFWNKFRIYAIDQFQVIEPSGDRELDILIFLFLSSRIAHLLLEGSGLHRARFDGSFMLKIQVGHLNNLPCPNFASFPANVREELLNIMDLILDVQDRKDEKAYHLIDQLDELFLRGLGYRYDKIHSFQKEIKNALNEAIMFRWTKARPELSKNGLVD
ncbi:MAG: N-6 DNA methylase [Gemmatimonadetes bacterium]|nr:N-6 DNA methylase [Gemmatimonadota bacterium]